MHEGKISVRLGLRGIPAEAESLPDPRGTSPWPGSRASGVHIAHVSTRLGVDAIRAAKKKRIPVTAEATPHHFSLTDEAVCRLRHQHQDEPAPQEPGGRGGGHRGPGRRHPRRASPRTTPPTPTRRRSWSSIGRPTASSACRPPCPWPSTAWCGPTASPSSAWWTPSPAPPPASSAWRGRARSGAGADADLTLFSLRKETCLKRGGHQVPEQEQPLPGDQAQRRGGRHRHRGPGLPGA